MTTELDTIATQYSEHLWQSDFGDTLEARAAAVGSGGESAPTCSHSISMVDSFAVGSCISGKIIQ